MYDFLELLADFYVKLLAILNYFTFTWNGFEISILGVLIALSFFAFVASAFWRGAKK